MNFSSFLLFALFHDIIRKQNSFNERGTAMFKFTDDCLIGIDELDDQHRYLFSLINKGLDLLNDEYLLDRYEKVHELLDELDEYAEEHFSSEEAYMEEIRDPELMRQRIQHDDFRDRVRDFSFVDIESEEEQQQMLQDLMEFMAKWLYRHIIGSDIMIGKLPPLEEWMIRENPCEFTDEYLTGIDLIDAEHRTLFELADEAYRYIRSGTAADSYDEVLKLLDNLKQYAAEHFRDEEEYMESIHYEGLETQHYAHEAFVHRMESIDLTQVEKDPQRQLEELINFLLGWLINHILIMDKKIPQQ